MTIHVLLCIDFEQEMCGKHPTRFASPDGGSDPIVSESNLERTNERYRSSRTIRSAPQ